MIFVKTWQKTLKQSLIFHVMGNRPLPKANKKKLICVMKDELGGKIMKDHVG